MLISRLVNNFFIFINVDLAISILVLISLVWSPDCSIQVPRYLYVGTFSIVVFAIVRLPWFRFCGDFVTTINLVFFKLIFRSFRIRIRSKGFTEGVYWIFVFIAVGEEKRRQSWSSEGGSRGSFLPGRRRSDEESAWWSDAADIDSDDEDDNELDEAHVAFPLGASPHPDLLSPCRCLNNDEQEYAVIAEPEPS